jgi:hypothetical protein
MAVISVNSRSNKEHKKARAVQFGAGFLLLINTKNNA